MNKICILVTLFAMLWGAFAQAQVAIAFGPNPRSHDNLQIWDYGTSTGRAQWTALRAAGVRKIVLNATFLARHHIDEDKHGGVLRPKPAATFLKQPEFQNMADMVQQDGFQFSVIGGLGLSTKARCRQIRKDPHAGAVRAAREEFNNIFVPMLSMGRGVPIHEIAIDGLFLRLIAHSQKAKGCHSHGISLSVDQTVVAADAYLKTLWGLIRAHPNQRGIVPRVVLIVNLPNWHAGGVPRVVRPSQDVSLSEVFEAFNKHRTSQGMTPSIHRIRVDYPFCYVVGQSLCVTGGAARRPQEAFARKMDALWQATRAINPPRTDGSKTSPLFSVVVNTREKAVKCAERYRDRWPSLLVYRACVPQPKAGTTCPDSSTWTQPDTQCLNAQAQKDYGYMEDAKRFADSLQPGGRLWAQLNASTAWSPQRIVVDELVFQTWFEGPLFNATYMKRVTDYARQTLR